MVLQLLRASGITASLEDCITEYANTHAEQQEGLLKSLKGSKLSFPQLVRDTAISEDLQRRREYLQRRAESRAYDGMIGDLAKKENNESVGKLIPKLSIGLNMTVAMATGFIVAYVAASSVFSKVNERLVVGLFGLIAIMFIEMVLFVIRETKHSC
jgi:hypothetical protein